MDYNLAYLTTEYARCKMIEEFQHDEKPPVASDTAGDNNLSLENKKAKYDDRAELAAH